MTRFEDRTPRRRRGLKRQRRSEYAGMVARTYRSTVILMRAGEVDSVPEPLVKQIRSLLKGEPLRDPSGQPSTLTESARSELLNEFIANGMTLDPQPDSKADAC